MIELRNVSKRFGKAEIIKQINADFETGKITGIVGNNGSGKTVLFKMICGLMLPTQGEITVNGERIGKDVDFPSSIGIIIETPGFINWQSGYQNLEKLGHNPADIELLCDDIYEMDDGILMHRG